MKQNIDLNAELQEWFGNRLSKMLGGDPENINDCYFDLDEAKKDLVRIVYDRLYSSPERAKLTADFFCISRKTVYNYVKK